MFAAGICANGKTRIYFVPPTTKLDRWFFIDKILRLIVKKDIPGLYPGKERLVCLHFDSAGIRHLKSTTGSMHKESGI
jgi:hypothetical protein